MIQVVKIKNPFEPTKYETQDLYYTGKNIASYVEVEGYDIVLNGEVVEDAENTYPQDGSQLVTMPHIGGKSLKKILGYVAMIALTAYASAVAGGLWGGIFKAGSIAATLASGAVMAIGGKLINSIFPQQDTSASFRQGSDYQTTTTYGWDTPQPQTAQGYPVGETYGECIPTPQLLSQHIETSGNNQYISLLYCGGYGVVDEIKDIKISGTAIENFTGVQIETRLGTNTQKPISFFKNTPLDEAVSVELGDNAIVRTSSSRKAVSLECTMEWPSGLFRMNDNGDYENSTVQFRLEYRKTGTQNWKNFTNGNYSVTAATSSALRRFFRVEGLEPAQYDVRATMVSRDKSSRAMSTTSWSLLTAYDDGVYSRPNKVLVGLRILATNQLSGSTPQITWKQTRKHVYVYNPNVKAYEQKDADNPIWAAYDILHHCRSLENPNTGKYEYVADGVPHTALDTYFDEWESAAAYADEMVVNYLGEEEPRFRFDAYIDTTQKRIEAAQKAATVGHAAIVPHGRNYGIVVDRPAKVTQIFGEGRTTVSSVKGSFSSKDDRARAVEVTYSDEEYDFTNSILTVRSPLFNTNALTDNTAQLSLFGVKRRSQAYREAITALATNERQIQSVELSTDIDGIVAEYGDIVGYNHTVSQIGIASGRIVSVEGNDVTLDKDVEMYDDRQYEIYIQLADDTLVKRDVVAKQYTGNVVTVALPFNDGQVPQLHDNYAFGEAKKAVKPFRITSASRSGDFLVNLKLSEYDEAIYATELDYSKYPVVDYTYKRQHAAVKFVTATENSYTDNGQAISDVNIEWQITSQGTVPTAYIVEIASESGQYVDHISTQLTSCTFHNVKVGQSYNVTVKAMYDVAVTSKGSASLYVAGIAMPAGNLNGLNAYMTAKGIRISWNPPMNETSPLFIIQANGETIEEKFNSTTYLYRPDNEGLITFKVQTVDADGNLQGVAQETTIDYKLPDAVKDAETITLYRTYADGTTGYDVVVTFRLPQNGDYVDLYYKTNNTDMTDVAYIECDVPAEEIGFLSDWRLAGSGENRIVIPHAQVGDTYRLKLVTRDNLGYSSPLSDCVFTEVTIEAKTTIPDTPQNLTYDFSKEFTFQWQEVTNADIDFYEVRTDKNIGAPAGMLARTVDTSCAVSLSERAGTVYVYARNTSGKYSAPVSVKYSMERPDMPVGVSIIELARGIRISVHVRDGVTGYAYYIKDGDNNRRYESVNPAYDFHGDAGIYTVQVAYIDLFGEGYKSPEYTATIKATFDSSWIEDGTISIEKMDAVVGDAVQNARATADKMKEVASKVEQHDDKITSVVTSLNDPDEAVKYSALAQMVNAINMRVVKGDVINQINMTADGTTIDGKYLHVTGTTKFDNDIITEGMLQAGSITADKLAASTISLQGAQGIQGGAVILNEKGMTVTTDTGAKTIFDGGGISFQDSNGIPYAHIGRMIMGVADDGDYIKFATPWDYAPTVIVSPQAVPSYSHGEYGELETFVYAEDVTNEGFRVRNYTSFKISEKDSVIVGLNTQTKGASNGGGSESVSIALPTFEFDYTVEVEFTLRLGYQWYYYYKGKEGTKYGNIGASAQIGVDNKVVTSCNASSRSSQKYTLSTTVPAGSHAYVTAWTGNMQWGNNMSYGLLEAAYVSINSYRIIGASGNVVTERNRAFFVAVEKNSSSYTIEKG